MKTRGFFALSCPRYRNSQKKKKKKKKKTTRKNKIKTKVNSGRTRRKARQGGRVLNNE